MYLNLKTFVDETLDIETANGTIIHIPRPGMDLLRKIQNTKTPADNATEAEAKAVLDELTSDVLNSNIDGVKFSADDIAALSIRSKLAIVNAYTMFMNGIAATGH